MRSDEINQQRGEKCVRPHSSVAVGVVRERFRIFIDFMAYSGAEELRVMSVGWSLQSASFASVNRSLSSNKIHTQILHALSLLLRQVNRRKENAKIIFFEKKNKKNKHSCLVFFISKKVIQVIESFFSCFFFFFSFFLY